MTRIFLDASVIYSGCYSDRGHSHDLLLMAVREEIELVGSRFVLEEVRRNLAKTSEEHLLFLDFVLDNVGMEIVRPTKRQVLEAAQYVALKDAPIIAGAKRGEVDYLVSLDKKHMLDKPDLEAFLGSPIVTPKQGVSQLRKA